MTLSGIDKSLVNRIMVILFTVVCFFLTRQVPFSFLSVIMNIGTFGLVIAWALIAFSRPTFVNPHISLLVLLLIVFLGFNLVYSIFVQGNSLGGAFRFFSILLLIIFAYHIDLPKSVVNVFMVLITIQAVVIVLFELYLMLFFNQQTYMPIRFVVLANNWGDVYSYDGRFYRIPIKGNALLPVGYMLTYVRKMKWQWILRGLFLVSIVCAGNFAYLIAVTVFHVVLFFYKKPVSFERWGFGLVARVAAVGLLLPLIISFVKSTIERKQDVSLALRNEQTILLMKDLSTSVMTFIFGNGLGHTMNVITLSRDYREAYYYELQGLYLLNQVGVLFALFFVAYNIIMSVLKYDKMILLVYVCYVIYAATNPYMFDTTHFVLLLVFNALAKDESRNTYA